MALQNKKRKSGSKKKLLIIAVFVVALAGASAFAFTNIRGKGKSGKPAQTTTTKLENKLGKEKTDAKGTSGGTSSTTKQATGDSQTGLTRAQGFSVTPVITYFGRGDNGQVEVNAFVPGIFETGTCNLTITSGSTIIATQSKPAQPNAQSTRCENFLVDGAGASAAWRAVVSYSSAAHSGSSAAAAYQN